MLNPTWGNICKRTLKCIRYSTNAKYNYSCQCHSCLPSRYMPSEYEWLQDYSKPDNWEGELCDSKGQGCQGKSHHITGSNAWEMWKSLAFFDLSVLIFSNNHSILIGSQILIILYLLHCMCLLRVLWIISPCILTAVPCGDLPPFHRYVTGTVECQMLPHFL